MLIFATEITVIVFIVWLVITQIVIPIWLGLPLFPMFRLTYKETKLKKAKEDVVLDVLDKEIEKFEKEIK